jgi:hypothetical protein
MRRTRGGSSFALFGGGIERCIFQKAPCSLFDLLNDPKYDELPRSLIMNSASRTQKSICVVSVCRSVAHPNPRQRIHPRDQSTRRIKLLPRRKCRSALSCIWRKGDAPPPRPSPKMISVVAADFVMLLYYIYLAKQQIMLYEFEIGWVSVWKQSTLAKWRRR